MQAQHPDVIATFPADGAPRSGAGWLDQVEAQIAAGQVRAALARLLPVVQTGGGDLRILTLAATCYWDLDDHKTAVALMQVATTSWPDNALAWGKLGAMAMYSGDRETARAAFAQSLRITPKSASALAALNRLDPFARDSKHVRQLRDLARNRKVSARDRMMALNALGRVEERAGNFRAAFGFFSRSNGLADGRYDPVAIDQKVTDQIRLFQPGDRPPVSGPVPGPRLVFIVGLPRSGTTLVESVLARHPTVRSVGESTALADTLKSLKHRIHGRTGQAGAWDWVTHMTDPELQAARDLYLTRSGAISSGPHMTVLDKMPMNCLDIGLAHLMFPEARFIFLQRHPLDVGLSNFSTAFDHGNGFSTRLDWIGHITRAAYRSIDDYIAKLGDTIRVQSYRALVQSPEDQIPALVDHADLDWDAACLHPEQADGAVRTASVLQVREKINTAGLGKWHRYQAQLGPLIDALGGQDWIDVWDARDNGYAGQAAA